MTPIQASEKTKAKEIYSNLQVKKEQQKPKLILGDLVRITDFKRVF